jgi:rRNA maturation RNase YbeY
VGHAASAGAHRAVFGDDDPTDVITMTYAPMPGMDVGASGELVVNIERAVEEGTRRSRNGWTPAHELALYIAHGVDHLTGADDANPADRRRMRARELTWVRSAERRGLLRNLLRVEA